MDKGGVGRNQKWGYDLPILMYICVLFVCEMGDVIIYLLDMCFMFFRVPYVRDGRCCVVEKRFESGERVWVLFRDHRSAAGV